MTKDKARVISWLIGPNPFSEIQLAVAVSLACLSLALIFFPLTVLTGLFLTPVALALVVESIISFAVTTIRERNS